ncbi:SHOCT domain-containing protein [Acholeplasma granularum]|uniref:SHOCT domain-containing protein n=1 Tax=Acholeplasma granularum TaxID=264635 RepID=UPI000472CDF5|nr:SHOCT domain-containing protein [Acholeplasma granularum]
MNKTFLTVSQVFQILGSLVTSFYIVFIGQMIFMFNSGAGFSTITLFIVLIIVSLYILVFIRFNQAKTNSLMKTEIIIYSIAFIITGNILAGVFGLVGALSQDSNTTNNNESSIEQKLKDLDNLFDKGLISLEEYQERRRRIIESI